MNTTDGKERSTKGDSQSKKRKRNEREDRAVAQKNDEDSSSRTATRHEAPSSLLKGRLFAVTTLVEASSKESPEAYSQIISLCKDLGAQTTGQVHRRVNAVIATESAVAGSTQRVRKAWKKGIPVISPDWIQACIKEGRSVEFRPYTHSQKERPHSIDTTKRKKVSTKSDTADVERTQERVINLGCCCVCHETEQGRTKCDWCLECSVNQQFAD